MRFALVSLAVSVVLAACGGASETAVGKGGGAGSGGAGGAGGGGCVAGDVCEVAGGVGICGQGTMSCADDGTASCVANGSKPEECNGLDDDCNGIADEACGVTLAMHGEDGAAGPMATSTAIPASGRATATLADLVGADPGKGWLEITSESPLPVGGVFSVAPVAGVAPHTLVPTVAPKQAAKTIVLPTYRFGGTMPAFSHVIDIVNPGATAAMVTFHAVADGGAPRADVTKPIAAHGSLRTSVPDLFALDPTQDEGGWLHIASDTPLVVAYREERTDEADPASDAGWAAPAKALVVPYFLVGPTSVTVVRMANDGATDGTVTLRAHPAGATALEASVTITAGARAVADLGSLFPALTAKDTRGFVEIVATEPVSAMARVIDAVHSGHALLGAVAGPAAEHVLADATVDASAGTDVVLGNPGTEATTATLTGFAADGSPGPRASVVLGPGAAFAGSLGALFNTSSFVGWVKVSSDRPTVGAYARYDADVGVGVTALQDDLESTAIVPGVQSAADGFATTVTLVLPDRR
jgi:hypothetical protein